MFCLAQSVFKQLMLASSNRFVRFKVLANLLFDNLFQDFPQYCYQADWFVVSWIDFFFPFGRLESHPFFSSPLVVPPCSRIFERFCGSKITLQNPGMQPT